MAVVTRVVAKIQPKSETLNTVPTRYGLEASGQTFKRGEVLRMNSSNQLTVGTSEPVDRIMGIAQDDASGTTNQRIPYTPAIAGVVYEANIGTSSTAGTSAASDVGKLYPLTVTSNIWFVDKTDGANGCVRVIDIVDDATSTLGRVLFEFLPHCLESSGMLHGSETKDWGSLADAADTLNEAITVTGAELGDIVTGVSLEVDIEEMILVANVISQNTVECTLTNESGSTVDLASTTMHVWVLRTKGV